MKKALSLILAAMLLLMTVPALAGSAVTLPVTDTPVTYTVMSNYNANLSETPVANISQTVAYQEFFKRTGVTLDISNTSVNGFKEAYNIMLASGDYPDVVDINPELGIANAYPGSLDAAVTDGVYIRLNELVEKYMPNYWALINSSKELRREAYTDGGNIVAIFTVFVPVQHSWYGPVVRQDWLDELGMKAPVTYDDWHEMLVRFKNEKGATAPLLLPPSGISAMSRHCHLISGYGAVNDFMLDENGKMTYGPVTEGFRKYVETMAAWYSEGLIDPDFYTRKDGVIPDTTLTNTGKAGAWLEIYTNIQNHKAQSDDPKIHVAPIASPVVKAGDVIPFNRTGGYLGVPGWAITTACKDPVPLLKALDYLYSEEGRLLADFGGAEGDTYEMIGGKPQFTSKIYANPDKMTMNASMYYYTMVEIPKQYAYTRELVGMPEEVTSAADIWSSNCCSDDKSRLLSQMVTMNVDEGNRSNAIMADVKTYVSENVVKFIIGERPLSEYDDFLAQLKTMNVDEAIAIRQAAYDRFLAR
jgi:putative aldouronate transport system substrate-binding protein